ncbi:hypothetical protein TanjilG_02921 [Lupinus angustifolius]|uniref:Spen paralogue and orthologue SPOC C-terminal domain-containing protein n=1 Tax=Lupinus angustifolius TaxID=3871 RepID=A0A1J7GA37_LUPAN|nr:PREDICTED: uncharacterized protein LOC109327263 [Lupinus angustifolius]OIV97213.1 hypothetical protein TanjilG_02921 [Lupinus angustifolius]
MNMVTNFDSHSLGTTACTKKAIKDLLANEARFDVSHVKDNKEDGSKEYQGQREGNIQSMKETGESNENGKQCSVKKSSLKYSSRTHDVVLGNIHSHGLLNSREKNKTLIRNVAPTGMLWDGCLTLNSSVTVSAVAIFKSGEKMSGVTWSESIEVKGKVKLDDFEKYIQDLPRSRNRRLMVVSLCWKEGSSKLALTGMKKVAKRYQECERVGFAELSPGIVLYVCPRTEAIITILAKYGFFKGKSAIEKNKDAMIGCVVWRRNQINLNPVELKSKRCLHQVAASKMSPIHLPSESLESPGNNFTTLDTKQNDRIKRDKNFPTSSKAVTSQPTPSILPSVPAGSEISHPDPENQHVSMEQTLKLKSRVEKSGEEQQDLNSKMQRHVSVPPDIRKQPLPIVDSEDLPEFDYGTPCGKKSQAVTNGALDFMNVNQNLPGKGFRHMDCSLPLATMPTRNSCPTLHKKRLGNLSHQGLSSDDDMQKQKKVCGPGNISSLPPVVDEQSRATWKPYGTPVASRTKNLFADDDDMPEWCPPDVNLRKQSIHVTNHSSNFPIFTGGQKLTHPVHSAPSQNPFSSTAHVAAHHSPFLTQTPHFAFNPFHGPVRHAQPRPSNLYNVQSTSSPMQMNCIQPLRSNSCLTNANIPINHEVWKGWMPKMPNYNNGI